MQHQEILFGRAGQSFTFDPPDGPPAGSPAPTVDVIAAGYVRATAGACTIDPVATALHGDAHAGSKRFRVTSVSGIAAGGRYLMTKPEGDREWIEVAAVRDDTLFLKHPLIQRYAGAATIVGCRISIAVDPAWVGASANLSDTVGRRRGLAGYVLRWTYTVRGYEVTGISFADLVSCRSEGLVTPQDVEKRIPNWASQLPAEHRANQGADFIAEAFRAVRLEAVGSAHAQRRICDAQILRELVNARANVIRLEHEVMFGGPRAGELAIAEQRYRSTYARLVEVPNLTKSYVSQPEPEPERERDRPRAKGSEPGVRRRIPKLTNH